MNPLEQNHATILVIELMPLPPYRVHNLNLIAILFLLNPNVLSLHSEYIQYLLLTLPHGV